MTCGAKGLLKCLRTALAFGVLLMMVLAATACERNRTFTDGTGRTVTLKGVPKRIVSLSPAHTENVFALGLGDRLVGVTTYCNRPAEAANIEKVGDAFNLNMEKLVSLKPDIVLCAGSRDFEAQYVKDMERLGIPVYVSGPTTVDEVLRDIESLSKVLGVEDKGKELSGKLQDELDKVSLQVTQRSERPRVFFCIDNDLWTVGPDSFISDVIYAAGGVNVIQDVSQQYMQISMEALLEMDPDVVIIAFPEEEAGPLSARPGWDSLSAVREGRVVFVNPDLVSRPSPAVVEGIVELHKALNP